MAEIDRTQGLVGNVGLKAPCRVASTANLTLSGEQTIDGVAAVTGDRVLVKDQTTGTQNGIYVVDTGDWNRAQDADGNYDFVEGTMVKVNNGTTGSGFWYISTTGDIVIDSTSITWARASTALATLSALWQGIVVLATTLLSRQALLLDKHGADILAAATIDLDAATGDVVDVTGNTGITAITLTEGVEKTVRFTGTPAITHGASLVLPGAASITAAAGDFAVFRGYAAGVVRCVAYTKANGGAVVLPTYGRVVRTAGNLTTTSTSLVDVTGATVTITTGANPVHWDFCGTADNSTGAQWVGINIDIDGSLQYGTVGKLCISSNANDYIGMHCSNDSAALSAGSHTIKAQWAVSANTGTIQAGTAQAYVFSAHEIR